MPPTPLVGPSLRLDRECRIPPKTTRKPEPTVRALAAPCPGRAGDARGSWRRVVPMTSLAVDARLRVRARNGLALRRIRLGRHQCDFASWTSASNHVALVVSTAVTPSPMLRQASSNWPSSAYTLAKHDECNGIHNVVPVDRNAAMPEAILWTASEALSVSAKRQPSIGVQSAFQVKEPFSSAKAISSSCSFVAVA
jgi:hypothetical protein